MGATSGGGYLGWATFPWDCTAPGDSVNDTPYEASPAYGCPTGRDTCSQAGLDPIENFIDYTDDPSMYSGRAGSILGAPAPQHRQELGVARRRDHPVAHRRAREGTGDVSKELHLRLRLRGGREEEEDHLRRFPVGRLEVDPVPRQAHPDEGRGEILDPRVGRGDAMAEAGGHELLAGEDRLGQRLRARPAAAQTPATISRMASDRVVARSRPRNKRGPM
jgi:hypothetical protein